jgi:hypothetical protein
MNENGWAGSGFGIIALLVILGLFNGGFGGGWGNRGGAIGNLGADEMSNSLQTNILEGSANQRQNCMEFTQTNSNISNGFSNLSRDLCTLGTSLGSAINSGNADIKDRLFSMSNQMSDCCCTVQRGIDSVNYNNAINTASINANTTAQVQKVLDTLCQDKISALQGKINSLELNQAVAGVVRYPTSATFNAGYPFGYPYAFGGFNGCGCNGNI